MIYLSTGPLHVPLWLPLLAFGKDTVWANGCGDGYLVIAAYTDVVVLKSGSGDYHLDVDRSVLGFRDGT